jgi:RHS repeat-associated protein
VSSAGTTTLAYDYEGRISTITYPSTATNTFTYNGLDTRVSKVDSAGTATYKRDGAGVTAPVLSDASAVYTPGISERRSSTTTYLHSGLKNADSQSGTGQTIAATKQYDAFGNVLSSTGTWKGPFSYAGSFGYQEDADSSLKLLGHRYYDPSTGRFLTRDPIKDGRNWYVYCQNNPMVAADPTGNIPDWLQRAWKWTVDAVGSIGKGIGAISSTGFKIIGLLLLVRPVAAFFEVLYESGVNGDERE